MPNFRQGAPLKAVDSNNSGRERDWRGRVHGYTRMRGEQIGCEAKSLRALDRLNEAKQLRKHNIRVVANRAGFTLTLVDFRTLRAAQLKKAIEDNAKALAIKAQAARVTELEAA